MKIEINNEKALVFTPYSPDFVKKIKSIGGARWKASVKAWEIPAASVETARHIMMEVYGETDQSAAIEKVDVQITALDDILEYNGSVALMGRSICTAWGRDSGARVSEGVDFIEGEPESGGSAKNWCSVVPEGCVFIVRDVVKSIAEEFIKADHEDLTAKIIANKTPNKKALEEEKAKLLERIAEIDRLLSEC